MQVIRALQARDARVWEVAFVGRRRWRMSKWAVVVLALLLGMRPIVMHAYLFEACRPLHWLSRRWVVWAHGIEVWGRHGLRMSPNLGSAERVIAVSRFTSMQIRIDRPDLPVTVVHPCAMCDVPGTKSVANCSNEIVTVARLSTDEAYKGHDLTMEALGVLSRRGILVRYHIIGKGDRSEIDRLGMLARHLGIDDHVTIHGYLSDPEVSKIYSRSRAMVMPSQVIRREDSLWGGEGFGIVYVEAAMHGLPSIGCIEGGQTDIIIDGVTGRLVPPDPAALANAIEELCDPVLSRQMGAEARRRAEAEFSFDRFRRSVWGALAQD